MIIHSNICILQAKFKIDGSVEHMAKIIKQLALRVIKTESEYQSKLIDQQMQEISGTNTQKNDTNTNDQE